MENITIDSVYSIKQYENIESILKGQIRDSKIYYYVKWREYPDAFWIPVSYFTQYILDYLKTKGIILPDISTVSNSHNSKVICKHVDNLKNSLLHKDIQKCKLLEKSKNKKKIPEKKIYKTKRTLNFTLPSTTLGIQSLASKKPTLLLKTSLDSLSTQCKTSNDSIHKTSVNSKQNLPLTTSLNEPLKTKLSMASLSPPKLEKQEPAKLMTTSLEPALPLTTLLEPALPLTTSLEPSTTLTTLLEPIKLVPEIVISNMPKLKQQIFECKPCNKQYKSEQGLIYHNVHKHFENYNYKCSICSNKFKKKKILTMHNNIFHSKNSDKLYYCKYCPCVFKIDTTYTRHVKKFHSDTCKFICTICNKKMVTKRGLMCHITYVHKIKSNIDFNKTNTHIQSLEAEDISDTELKKNSNIDIYKCSYCLCIFSSYKRLSNHIYQTHRDKLNFICNVCNKKYLDAVSLRQHKTKNH